MMTPGTFYIFDNWRAQLWQCTNVMTDEAAGQARLIPVTNGPCEGAITISADSDDTGLVLALTPQTSGGGLQVGEYFKAGDNIAHRIVSIMVGADPNDYAPVLVSNDEQQNVRLLDMTSWPFAARITNQ